MFVWFDRSTKYIPKLVLPRTRRGHLKLIKDSGRIDRNIGLSSRVV